MRRLSLEETGDIFKPLELVKDEHKMPETEVGTIEPIQNNVVQEFRAIQMIQDSQNEKIISCSQNNRSLFKLITGFVRLFTFTTTDGILHKHNQFMQFFGYKKLRADSSSQTMELEVSKMWTMRIKYGSLLCLVVHGVVFIQVMKCARLSDPPFITSTVVIASEMIKLIASFVLMIIFDMIPASPLKAIHQLFCKSFVDVANVTVVASAYVIMNYICYVASSNLDVITYQVISQLKIPISFLFSICFLRVDFSLVQWLSLVIMMTGVITVQISDVQVNGHQSSAAQIITLVDKNLGIATAFSSAILSGFSSVYLERILKNKQESVWTRNFQLSFISIPLATVECCIMNGTEIIENGFFYGYDKWAIALTLLQSIGGLVVALSVLHADSVAKSYANSVAMVISCIFSYFYYHYTLNYLFLSGAALVIIAIPLHACFSRPTKSVENETSSALSRAA